MESSSQQAVPFSVRFGYIFSKTWRFFFSILVPLLLLPIFLWHPVGYEKAPYAMYLTLLMAAYWVSECIPLAITSLLPIVLVPLFGIGDSDEICGVYFNQTIIFLFGGCVVALAFEYSDLHTRISFFVMKSVGAQASTLLFGMMMTCMVLSCWMNNTSTTAMMVPVITSIMKQYENRLIPKETAVELAEKYGGTNPLDIPKFVESKAVVPAKNIKDRLPILNVAEGRTSKVEPEPPLPETPNVADTEGVTDPSTVAVNLEPPESDDFLDVAYWENVIDTKKKYVRNLEIMFMVGVAVSSNIGGTGVITGTGTNLIASSQLRNYKLDKLRDKLTTVLHTANFDECFEKDINGYWDLDFLRWIVINFLSMVVNVLVSWVFLSVFYQGLPDCMKHFWRTKILKRRSDVDAKKLAADNKTVADKIQTAIRTQYKELGPTSFHQWMILGLFFNLVLLWIFRNPMFGRVDPVPYKRPSQMTTQYTEALTLVHPYCLPTNAKSKLYSTWGWSRYFGDECDEGYLHDYVATMLVCFLLFVLPKEWKYYKNAIRGGIGEGLDDPLLPFDFVARHTPWGPLFMLGGGFGISKAIANSHLDAYLSEFLNEQPALKTMSSYSLLAAALAFVAVMTTIASNTATAVIVSPILIELARVSNVPPLYLLVPPIVGASYAFCLPISTPPNAIVYDKANMKQLDMFIPGLWLTVICNVVLYLMTISWTSFILDVPHYKGPQRQSPILCGNLLTTIEDDETMNISLFRHHKVACHLQNVMLIMIIVLTSMLIYGQ